MINDLEYTETLGPLILEASRVGINKSSTSAMLHVGGDIRADGYLMASDFKVDSEERTLMLGPAEFQPRVEWHTDPGVSNFQYVSEMRQDDGRKTILVRMEICPSGTPTAS